ncbi:hypothetical protein ACJIZ3_018796 [Penstemon smallii]|uniref:Uncharacterized protein n=1 Tax=Penstemon smallii TaxID=265156 RepID=A0ABD3SZC1_9LAMI
MNTYSISAQFQYRLIVRHQKSEGRESEAAIRRRRTLRRVDSELEKGNFKAALSLVKQLQGKSAGLRGFGVAAAAKVPRSALYLDEAKLSGDMEISSLNLIIDSIIRSIKCSLEFQLLEEQTEEVLVQEFGEVVDGESLNSLYEDHLMCVQVRYCLTFESPMLVCTYSLEPDILLLSSSQHEAGHFLIGYMLGVLPKRYKVPSMKDLFVDKFASGKVEFIGFEFLSDVHITTKSNKKFTRGKLSKKTLKNFSCVILGGLVAEHLSFGYSELLHSDVQKVSFMSSEF